MMSGLNKALHSVRPQQAPFHRLRGKRRKDVHVVINTQYFCFHVCRLMLMQAPCQKARLTREKCSSPREHCGNTDAGAMCQVIAEQPPMISRLSYSDAVAIKSKPRALTRHLAICVGSAPGALALKDSTLKVDLA